jgi:hypothetical protein
MKSWLFACLLMLAPFLAPAPAAAAECNEITTFPATLSGGNYCLTTGVASGMTSGSLITIDAPGVKLDCRGMLLHATNTNPAANVYAISVLNTDRVSIRNCHITGGWTAGIYVYQDNGLANVNRDIDIRGNSIMGAYWYGILAYGTAISIRDNRIHDIGGRLSFAMGIRVGGSNVAGESRFFVVDGNEVSEVDSPGNNAYAIYGNNPEGSVFTNNAIYGTRVHNGSYDGYGVYLFPTAGGNNRITGNTITGTSAGSDIGILGAASDSCFDNLIRAMSTSVLTCDATHGNY